MEQSVISYTQEPMLPVRATPVGYALSDNMNFDEWLAELPGGRLMSGPPRSNPPPEEWVNSFCYVPPGAIMIGAMLFVLLKRRGHLTRWEWLLVLFLFACIALAFVVAGAGPALMGG